MAAEPQALIEASRSWRWRSRSRSCRLTPGVGCQRCASSRVARAAAGASPTGAAAGPSFGASFVKDTQCLMFVKEFAQHLALDLPPVRSEVSVISFIY